MISVAWCSCELRFLCYPSYTQEKPQRSEAAVVGKGLLSASQSVVLQPPPPESPGAGPVAVLQTSSFRISGEGLESRCFGGREVVDLSLASQCEELRVKSLGC